MSVADLTVTELLATSRQASARGKAVVQQMGAPSSDATVLLELLQRIENCARVLDAERHADKFAAPSRARERDEIAFLKGRLRQLSLSEGAGGPSLKKIDFLPGLAYNSHAPAASVRNIVRKLDAVDRNLDYFTGVPALQLHPLLEAAQEALKAIGVFLPYLDATSRISGVAVPTLTQLVASVTENGRILSAGCKDAEEREAIASALERFETHADMLVAAVDRPSAGSENDVLLYKRDCLRCCGELTRVLAPASLQRALQVEQREHRDREVRPADSFSPSSSMEISDF